MQESLIKTYVYAFGKFHSCIINHTSSSVRPCKRIPILLRSEDVYQARNKTPLHRSMTRVKQDDLIYNQQGVFI